MFGDLDATLAALLTDPSGVPPKLVAAEKSFVTPAKDYNPQNLTVNFFLQGLRENRDLRSSVPIMASLDGHYLKSAPPLRMDCTYLVTAWSPAAAETKVVEEHQLLGDAVSWLSRFPTVPDTMLQGSLKDPPQLYAVTMQVAQTKADEGLAHFWSALGIAPRPTFTLTVTIAMQSSPAVQELPRVETIDIRGVSTVYPALTGRVLDAALAPVPGAVVKVVENNQRATSDQRGGFAFGELPFDTYTLEILVHDDVVARPTITYQAAGQVHNVYLPAP
jgi:hypothetical protein